MEKQQIQKTYADVREVMDRINAAIDAFNAAAEHLNKELEAYGAAREDVAAFSEYMSTGQWKQDLSSEEGERFCQLLGEVASLEAQLRPQGYHCCHGHHDGEGGEHHCCHGHHEGEGEHHCCHGHHDGEDEHHCCHGEA